MDYKRLKYRISESQLSNDFKNDGETLYGEDLNRIVTITKAGINYNAELFESYLYGDEYRPFYHGNEVDWQTKDEYIDYGIVYWVRSVLDVLTGLPYVYVTKMEYNGTSESWVEKEIIKFIDTEQLNEVLEDYLKKSGGDMQGNIDMGGYDITNVDYLRAYQVRVDELNAERAVGGLTVENFLGVEGNANVTGSVSADKAITKEIALLSNEGQETASIKLDENGNIDFNGKTVVNIELPEVDAKLSGKLNAHYEETPFEMAYIKNINGSQNMNVISTTLQPFSLAKRKLDNALEVGTATSIYDAVPLGQLNGKLGTKVDKVEGKQLSDENFTSAEKSKLAGLESSRFVGQFVSLQALKAAYPTAPIGSYAYVDVGSGKDTVKYVWDSSDEKWVSGTLSQADLTPARVKQLYEENDDTNAYTDDEKGKVALIDNKLDKVSTTSLHSRAYVINEDGTQGHIAASYATIANTIARRSYWGNLEVGEAKTSHDAVPRGQADVRYVGVNGDQVIAGEKYFMYPFVYSDKRLTWFESVMNPNKGSIGLNDGKFNIENAAKNGEIAVMSDLDVLINEVRDVGETNIVRNQNGNVYQILGDQVIENIERDVNGRVIKVIEEYVLDGKTYETTFVRDSNGSVISYKKEEVI